MRGTYSVMIILSLFFSSLVFGEEEKFCENFEKTMAGCDATTAATAGASCEIDIVPMINTKCSGLKSRNSINDSANLDLWNQAVNKLRFCGQNTFKVISSSGEAISSCRGINAREVYTDICNASCTENIDTTGSLEKTKDALAAEAKEVLLKMYKNTIYESYDLIAMMPDENFIYDGLPKTCSSGADNVSEQVKKDIKKAVEKIRETHIDKSEKIITEDSPTKAEEECFPKGLVANYFKLGHGKFSYLDLDHGQSVKREIDFTSFKNVSESFDDYVDKCFSSNKSICSENIAQTKKDLIKEKIQKAKLDMAKKCENLQLQLQKLEDNNTVLGVALNPQVLNLRKNFEQISFKDQESPDEKLEYKISVSEACETYYETGEKIPPKITTIDINEQTCSSVKKLMCGQNQQQQKDRLDQILSRENTKPLENFYNSVKGMKRFVKDDVPAMEAHLCEQIKKKFYNHNNDTGLNLNDFTINYLSGANGVDNLEDLINKLKESDYYTKHFASEKEMEDFIKGLASFNTINKQAYFAEMNKRKKNAGPCYAYSQLQKLGERSKTAGNIVSGIGLTNSKMDEICFNVKSNITDIVKKTTTRSSMKFEELKTKGYKSFDTSMAGSSKEFRELDIAEPSKISRAPATINSNIINDSTNSNVGQISPPIPRIDQLNNNILDAQNSMNLAAKNIAMADQEIVATGLNQKGLSFEEAQNRIKRLEEDKSKLEEELGKQAILLEDLKQKKANEISQRDSTLNQEKKIIEAKKDFATVKTQNLDDLDNHPIFKDVPEIAKNTKVLHSTLNTRVVSPMDNKVGFEAILPMAASEYEKIVSQKNSVPVELKSFNPQVFQYRSFDEIKSEYGSDAIYQVGDSYFVKVSDYKTGDEVVYQLRTEKSEDGSMLVNGVFVPVSNKAQIKREVKRLPASVIQDTVIEKEKLNGEKDPKKLSRSITDSEVKNFQVDLYRELIMVLKELK